MIDPIIKSKSITNLNELKRYSNALRGINIRISNTICLVADYKQYRFPKSKKKRIRAKWTKNKQNFRFEESDRVICIGDTVYMSQKQYDKFSKKLKQ